MLKVLFATVNLLFIYLQKELHRFSLSFIILKCLLLMISEIASRYVGAILKEHKGACIVRSRVELMSLYLYREPRKYTLDDILVGSGH